MAGRATRTTIGRPGSRAGTAPTIRSSPTRTTRGWTRVCSDDDPFCPEGAAARYGPVLGVPVDVLPGQGHLNATAGYGPWPEVEAFCGGQDSAITSSRMAPG